MLLNEPEFQRHHFNSHQQRHNYQQAAICVWISGIIIIIAIILSGVKLINYHQTVQQQTNHNHVSRHVTKSDRSERLAHNKSTGHTNQSIDQPSVKKRNVNGPSRQHALPSQPAFQKQRFASVTNAKEWARATQQRWLHQGYDNYVVRSDGQGNYYLQFTK